MLQLQLPNKCLNGLEAEDLPMYSLFINVAGAKTRLNNSTSCCLRYLGKRANQLKELICKRSHSIFLKLYFRISNKKCCAFKTCLFYSGNHSLFLTVPFSFFLFCGEEGGGGGETCVKLRLDITFVQSVFNWQRRSNIS